MLGSVGRCDLRDQLTHTQEEEDHTVEIKRTLYKWKGESIQMGKVAYPG